MSRHFTHLHLHTEFSLLDGAISIEKLIDFGKKNNFKSLAISDHGNIFGAVKFFQQAEKAGIKPVLGMEAYFTQDARVKNSEDKYYHLILLVQNEIGYKNLCKLIAYSFQEGFYFKPRIDYNMLEQHADGLIITSACLGGHVPSLLMQNQEHEALERIDWFLRVFGPDRFYLEVQPEDQHDQKLLNEKLFEISARKSVQLVATGDCHYVNLDDREAHEVMLSIQTHAKITDPDRFSFGDCRAYMRTESEMLALFKDHESAVWNTGKIADMCNFKFVTGKLFFPQFEIPPEHTQDSYFTHICREGLAKLIADGRIGEQPINTRDEHQNVSEGDGQLLQDQKQFYSDRLELEITLIINMGFVGYFLVVSDFIQWARQNNIPVGPGRGSVAGSLVAWALQITDIDPIKYNLLFERFLNPERVSMPDIDIDFCIEGRDRVIEYVREKYGHDKVCQIITFGTMMAKGVIKDVARVLGFPFEDSNSLTDLIPDQLKITLEEALEQEPKLKDLIAQNPNVAKLFDLARRLEGITRHASKHAAGIVISPEPISNVLPIYTPPKTTDLVTQYAMTELETLGFLKMDFLGLKNLTLIQRAVELIKLNYNFDLDITKLPLNNKNTFALLCRGETSGVFQLESDGLKDVLRRLQPTSFEDIIAVNALYRPGPLGSGMVDDFIARKQGKQEISYIFPELEPILQETYGVIVYQEQVMKIASAIAGYSLGESDILRRAMGKKKADVMAEQKAIFTDRAIKNNFNAQKAGELFDLMAYFAGYGFNKSHSAAYALIAYQTAYLKANYGPEFMACLISLEASDGEKMAFYVQEAKDMGIAILPPDINYSQINFSVIDGKIRFGLRGIKNVGTAALDDILREREKQAFSDLFEFCSRIDLRTSNKRVIESLICAGAFDQFPGNRAQKYDEVTKIIDLATDHKKALKTGQMGLFGMLGAGPTALSGTTYIDTTTNTDVSFREKSENSHPTHPEPVPSTELGINSGSSGPKTSQTVYQYTPKPEWSDSVKLEKEKEVVGLYVSAQPLDAYNKHIKWIGAITFKQAAPQTEQIVICAGLLKTNKTIKTKKGDLMAFLQLEDSSGKAEIVVFPKLYTQIEPWLSQYHVFAFKGTVDVSNQLPKIKAQSCVPLDLLFEQWASERVILTLPESIQESNLALVKSKCTAGSTPLELRFSENGKMLKLTAREKIRLEAGLFALLEEQQIQVAIKI